MSVRLSSPASTLRRWRALVAAAVLLTLPLATTAQINIEIPTTLVGWNAFANSVQWPEVGVSTDGVIVFIWEESGSSAPRAAVTHPYSADGVELGPPTKVNNSGNVSFVSVVSDQRGGFVATWDWNENSGNDYIIARRLDGLGRGIGTQMVVNADRPTNAALLVRAAGLSTGSVFMWEQGYGTWMRLYDENGNARGPSSMFGSGTHFTHVTNDVVPLSTGGFVLAWADLYAGGSWARLYDDDGQPRTPAFVLSDGFDVQRIAAFDGGWAAIGTTSNMEWSDPPPPVYTTNRILVRRFDNDGQQLGADIEVHDAGYRKWLQTDLTFDTRGNLYATWISLDWDYPNLLSPPNARAFDAGGAPYGEAVVISDKRGYDVHPEALPNGNIVTVWEGQGNVPYEATVYAAWVRICAADEVCEVPPTFTPRDTATPTNTPVPSATAVPTPGCGDAILDANEECDDGNRVNGDGCDWQCLQEQCGNGRLEGNEQCDPPDTLGFCRADCTRAPIHDSVMVPEKAIDIVIPAGQGSVTKIVPMQVRNADIEPVPERPGHVIRLIASDGDCPAGTILGLPDFERGIEGDQDSILVAGGTPKTAHVVIFASHQSFPKLDPKIPTRCTLVFSAEALVDGNIDPTPDNNTITVELNVRTATAPPQALAAAPTDPGFFIRSAKPLKAKIRYGRSSASKAVKVKVSNGLPAGSPDRQIGFAVEDGSCPPGTVTITEFAGIAGGGQAVWLRAGRSVSGKLLVTATDALFTSANNLSPGRCTAMLVASDPSGADERANQRTALMVEATDANDYAP
jgi:cysteine-rich repeat protein